MNHTTGIATVVAGTGTSGFSGDGGAATSAQLNSPKGVSLDSAGNIYIADSSNHRIRKIDVTTGNISTIAGTGTGTFGGDNAAATAARVNSPQGVCIDSSGNVYIADTSNNRVRKIDAVTGNISTVAGNGTGGYLADNVAATATRINGPRGVAVDSSGNFYIADTSNNRIRKVDTGGTITTYAGTGTASFSGDNGAATSAAIRAPQAVTLDGSGNMYIADTTNHRIRKITSGIITTISGTGAAGYGGDNGVATSGQLSSPAGIAVDSSGNIYIGDTGNLRLRKISGGNITTYAGTGSATYGGDGGLATNAQFTNPQQVVIDGSGNFYLSDSGTHRVRKLATDGTVTTIAGTGVAGYSGDNGPATSAQINTPLGIAMDGSGNLYIADGNNNRIRKVDTSGTITTFAGDGTGSFGGDNGPATNAQLFGPFGVLVIGSDLYITDTGNNRVRKVDAGGTIMTIAGNGTAGYAGDNGAAINAQFNTPIGIAADNVGNLYVTDYSNGSVRKISTDGTITTVAGNGANGYGGDNGPATSAQLNSPRAVAVDSAGNIFITDTTNSRIRKVDLSGNISTIAGTGSSGFNGDYGDPAATQVSTPQAITVDASGVIYFGDTGNRRFRRIGPAIPYTLTYNGNNATGGIAPSDPNSPYSAGSTVTVSGNTGSLVKTGYVFSDWNTAADGSGAAYAATSTFTITGTTTLYAQWTVSPIPSAPTNLIASVTGSTVSLAWTNPTEASFNSCMIRRSMSGYPTSITDGITVAPSLAGMTFSDTNLSDGVYYYAVFALNGSGGASTAATVNALVDTTPPDAPELSAVKPSSTSNSVELAWNVPSTTATFTLRRSTFSYPTSIMDGTLVQANIANSTTTLSETALADATYYYSLFALDSYGNVSNAGTAAVTIDTTPPDAPILVASKPSANGSSVELAWNAPASTATFMLRRSTSAYPTSIVDGTLVQSNIASSTTTLSQAALADGIYYYALFAFDAFGNVSNAGTTAVTIDTTAPAAPMDFAAAASGSTIALSWTNPSTDFASCTLRRSTSTYPTSINDGTAVFSNFTGAAFNNTALADGTYYYAIFALDAAGNVSSSATATATVDTTAATVTSIARQSPSASTTSETSVTWRVTFSEAVSGVGSVSFGLTTTGTAAGIVGTVSAVSSSIYDVSVNLLSRGGTIRLDLLSNSGISNARGNAMTEDFTNGESFNLAGNLAPSFTAGGDVSVAQNSGVTTRTNWATNINAGAPNELGQTLSFTITVDDQSLFTAPPSISPNGTLTISPAAKASGTATATVTLKDNGGRADGGEDTSAPVTFKIAVTTYKEEAGTYNGLVQAAPLTTPSNDRVGLLHLKLTKTGAFTGTLKLAGQNFPLKGAVDEGGVITFGTKKTVTLPLVRKKGQSTLQLALQLDVGAGTDKLSGTITDNAQPFAVIDADRALYTAAKKPVAPFLNVPAELIGKYTVVFAAKSPAAQSRSADVFPQGDGIGLLTVTKAGIARITGTLADGTAISYTNALSKENHWPFYVSFAAGKGSISSPIRFENTPNVSDLDGLDAVWFKPADSSAKNYPNGWPDGLKTDVLGSKFVIPPTAAKTSIFTGLPVPDSGGNAMALFSDGDLPAGIQSAINVSAGNIVKVIDKDEAQLTMTMLFPFERGDGPAAHRGMVVNGLFTGSFVHPVSQTRAPFKGVIFQKQKMAFGFFTGPTSSGSVVLEPQGK